MKLMHQRSAPNDLARDVAMLFVLSFSAASRDNFLLVR